MEDPITELLKKLEKMQDYAIKTYFYEGRGVLNISDLSNAFAEMIRRIEALEKKQTEGE